jgi:hypothetical protein
MNNTNQLPNLSQNIPTFPFDWEDHKVHFDMFVREVTMMASAHSRDELTGDLWKWFEKVNEQLDMYETLTANVTTWRAEAEANAMYLLGRLIYSQHCNKIYKDDYHKVLKDLGDAPEGGEED